MHEPKANPRAEPATRSDNGQETMSSASLPRLYFRHHLDKHGIQIQNSGFDIGPSLATAERAFSGRKVRYTVAIGYRRITRETACDKLSVELAAFISDRKATLVGIEGINGFRCGPTEDELRMFAHSLDDIHPQKMG